MSISLDRRTMITAIGLGLAAQVSGAATADAHEGDTGSLIPENAKGLTELTERLAHLPRRRDFKTVPMILSSEDQWDHEALDAVIGYAAQPKQVWDNTAIGGPWLNSMRNSLNVQIWSFKHPDFLVVSGTHGTANLALYDQPMWEKYQLSKLAGDKFKTNTLIVEKPAASLNPKDYEAPDGVYSSEDNSIVALQRRGVVFLSCHNAIWEQAAALFAHQINPDKLSHEALAAELTNHLIPGAILTPGVAGAFPELHAAGFAYAK